MIDELLDSPHFGERSAQHWLDVARYADTAGLSNDYERSNMWRYRDYVARSFNNDKAYDQFVVEQIAGDELWEKQPREKGFSIAGSKLLSADWPMGSGNGSQTASPSVVPRRRREFRGTNLPEHDHAMLQVPRS